MSELLSHSRAKRAEITAVVTRANGQTEDLGVIGYWHINPLFRWGYRIKRALGFH